MIIFICLLIGSFITFEIVNRHLIANISRSAVSLKSFELAKQDTQILFLGDSHFRCALDATQINNAAYNLTFDGANYIQLYYMLKSYIEKVPSLKIIILPVDLFSFSSFRTDRVNFPSFWNSFVDYSELKKVKGVIYLKNKYFISMIKEKVGAKEFVKYLKKLITGKKNNRSGQGKVYVESPSSAQEDFTLKRVKFHFDGHNAFDKDLMSYFKKILELCNEHNIRVVTMQTPNSSYYLDFSSKYVTYDKLSQEIIENPEYKRLVHKNLNYLALYRDKRDFFLKDGDHLNDTGKLEFSKYIAGDINKVLNRN